MTDRRQEGQDRERAVKRWKVAGLKVRAGVGLGIKRRDLADSDTFIVRDTEVRGEEGFRYITYSNKYPGWFNFINLFIPGSHES